MVKLSEFVPMAQPADPMDAIKKVQGSFVPNVPPAAGLEESSAFAAMPKQIQPKPYKG
jgi:hypothetical protein